MKNTTLPAVSTSANSTMSTLSLIHIYLVPESIMPAYPWLEKDLVDAEAMPSHMKALRTVGVPYTDADIAGATEAVKGKTEMEAVIAYLQVLGIHLK